MTKRSALLVLCAGLIAGCAGSRGAPPPEVLTGEWFIIDGVDERGRASPVTPFLSMTFTADSVAVVARPGERGDGSETYAYTADGDSLRVSNGRRVEVLSYTLSDGRLDLSEGDGLSFRLSREPAPTVSMADIAGRWIVAEVTDRSGGIKDDAPIRAVVFGTDGMLRAEFVPGEEPDGPTAFRYSLESGVLTTYRDGNEMSAVALWLHEGDLHLEEDGGDLFRFSRD